jgi:hypothetical protein
MTDAGRPCWKLLVKSRCFDSYRLPTDRAQKYNSAMCRAKRAPGSGVFLFAFLMCAHGSLPAQVVTRSSNAAARVPFVGCESDGQGGAVKAPSGQSKTLAIPAEAAQRLAYYKAEGIGVLAPRGWHCFGTYGSSGATLYVSPDPIKGADLFSTSWNGFAGPVIQISSMDGDTSGRFAVAKTIARVFPAHKAFVQAVIAEGIEPASSFPFGPYAGDTLKYPTKDIVEFLTPAHTDGLGTASWLRKNDSPISGAAILFGKEPNLLQLSVRLPQQASDLTQFIIQQTEREAPHFNAGKDSQK